MSHESAPGNPRLTELNGLRGATALIVYGCIQWVPVKRALCTQVLHILGDISFPFYLLHVPMIYTFLAATSLPFVQGAPFGIAAVVAVWLTRLIGLSYLAARFLEVPLVNQLHRIRTMPPGWWRNGISLGTV